MPRFAHIVRASPDHVWTVLVDAGARARWPKVADAAEGDGEGGGSYGRKGHRWVEKAIETDRPHKLVLHRIAGDAAKAPDRIEWRLQALQKGTLLVLEVEGTTPQRRLALMFQKRSQRRLLDAVKDEAEVRAPTPVPVAQSPPVEAAPSPHKAAPPAKPNTKARVRRA